MPNHLTAKQLRDMLAAVPDDAIIVTDGYETAMDPVDTTQLLDVVRVKERGYYLGTIEEANGRDGAFTAFYIGTGRTG